MTDVALIRHPTPLRPYWQEARCELLRMLRRPTFVVPTLIFPPLFYVLFAVVLPGPHARGDYASALLAGYGVFGVMAPGLFGFGVGIAIDRERGFLTLKRALPVPPGAMLVARMAMAMVFALVIALTVLLLGGGLAQVTLSPSQAILLLLVDVLGVLPFCALGLLIGSWASGQGAPAMINLLYLPMAFLGGLWLPIQALPHTVAQLAPLWPSYHLGQLAQAVVGRGDGSSVMGHIVALLIVTVVAGGMARHRLSRV